MPPKSIVAELFPEQRAHLKRVLRIMSERPYAIDKSRMGKGKTFIGIAIATAWRHKHLVVVCPLSVRAKWNELLEKYPISTLVDAPIILTFEALRGAGTRVPKRPDGTIPSKEELDAMPPLTLSHGLLTARFTPMAGAGDKEDTAIVSNFAITDKLIALAKDNTLFVIDEMHRAKNMTTATHESVTTLVQASILHSIGTITRTLLISGTLFDKPAHAVSLMLLLGIIQSREFVVFDKSTRSYFLGDATNQLVRFLKLRIDKLKEGDATPDYGQSLLKDKSGVIDFAMNIIADKIIPAISSQMGGEGEEEKDVKTEKVAAGVETTGTYPINVTNLVINVPASDVSLLEESVQMLAKAVGFDNKSNQIIARGAASKGGFSGLITKALMGIEQAKLTSLIRLAEEQLTKSSKIKVVVAVNFTRTLESISEAIRSYLSVRVEMLYGKTPEKKRAAIIRDFQNNSDDSLRVIVANMNVVSHGIDLDDQFGDRPREVFVSPSFYAIAQHQFVRRFFRRATRGPSRVSFVYTTTAKAGGGEGGEDAIQEQRIMAAIHRAASVMRRLHGSDIFFADDYTSVFESSSSSGAPPPSAGGAGAAGGEENDY
jgi:hypothetical protein